MTFRRLFLLSAVLAIALSSLADITREATGPGGTIVTYQVSGGRSSGDDDGNGSSPSARRACNAATARAST